jgi:type I restriction enzyme R subunit
MNELESLKNIFKDRIFKIPDYQRGYAWTERQLKDFWEDVVNLPADRFHYTGLLSLKKVDRNIWNNWNDERWLLEDRGYKPFHVEKDKKEFAKLFGEYLRVENILQNYDEFNHLKAIQAIDVNNPEAIEEFKKTHFVTDEEIAAMQKIELLKDRKVQDYRSTYNDIRDWLRREKSGNESEESTIDWDDVVFEVDLLKSQEINLDYILELIFENNKKTKDKDTLITEIRRVIRASVGNRAKESLVVDFINETNLDTLQDKANVIDSFFAYAQRKQKAEASELINEENLNEEEAKRYITASLKREYASENGTELNALLPKMSPLNPEYLTKKQSVFQKLSFFIEKFKGVGGNL